MSQEKTRKEKTYTPDEIAARLAAELPGWRFVDGTIRRTYKTSGWKSTMLAANAIGHLAETAWHHPDLLLSYPQVEVRLSTHTAGGITDKDFALAAKIEALIGWQPAKDGGPFEGPPDDHAHIAHA